MSSQDEQAKAQRYLQERQRQQQMALRAQQMAAMSQQQLAKSRQIRGVMGSQMANQMASQRENQMNQMSSPYDDIPIQEPGDQGILYQRDVSPEVTSFLTACRDGDMSTIESVVASQSRTPIFLHQGLINALQYGRVDAARYLLQSGAPIARMTPQAILKAPADQQIALFEALAEHGWTVNTPGYYGEVLLPRLIKLYNITLMDWFLANGADPNLSSQRDYRDRLGGPETNSCQALEFAAEHGSVDIVQKLLNAGAKVTNGAPLYYAAGACPTGANPLLGRVTPTKEFDVSRIPIMELLVERGAGVNDKLETGHMTAIYPIVNAVMAGAVERVKWLLDRGADPDLKGAYGSAKEYAAQVSSDEMKQALGVL